MTLMTDQQAYIECCVVRDKYSIKTTDEQWHLMILELGHILINEELSERGKRVIQATLEETAIRLAYLPLIRNRKD